MYRCTNIFYQCTTSHDYNPHTHAIVNSVYMIANHVTHGKGLYLLKIFAASQIGEGFSFAVAKIWNGQPNTDTILYFLFAHKTIAYFSYNIIIIIIIIICKSISYL